MKKNLLFAASLLTLAGALAACGTTVSNEGTPAEETATDGATEETTTEDTAGEESADPKAAEGTLVQSDEQPYELNVLPGYELSSEEPGKDSLYLTEDPSVFMRIETFALGEVDFAQAEIQLKETLKAVNPDTEVVEGPALKGAANLRSSSFEVPSAEGKVTGIVIEQENQLVRLTIFDSSAANAAEDFIAMGQSIERTE